MTNKQLASNSIEVINELLLHRAEKIFADTLNREQLLKMFEDRKKLSVKESGLEPRWKTVFKGKSSLSEGFATWKEVRIYLSGMRASILSL
jgi:hypothetical protein